MPDEPDDAALIALCGTFVAACDEIARLNAMDDSNDEELTAAVEAWAEPIDAIIATPATTAAGVRAKADAVIAAFGHGGGMSRYRWEAVEAAMRDRERMAWQLAYEIVAMGAGARAG